MSHTPLRWNDAKPSDIKKVRYGDHEAIFSLTNTGKATVLDVEFLCAGSPGFATGELVLELDNPASPRITIPYSCMVRK